MHNQCTYTRHRVSTLDTLPDNTVHSSVRYRKRKARLGPVLADHRSGLVPYGINRKIAMKYSVDAPPVRSLDVVETDTENADHYDEPNSRLRLNRQGLPVAIRRVVSIGQPGSFASQRYQVITPRKVVGLSRASLRSWEDRQSHPVN